MRDFFRLVVLTVLAAGCGFTTAARADWIRDCSIGGSYHDNLSNSQRRADKQSDLGLEAAERVGKFTQLSEALRFTFTLDLAPQLWAEHTDLDNFQAGGSAALRWRFGLGAMAPFLRTEVSAHYAGFGQDLQDGGRYRGAITLGKRLTERLEVPAAFLLDSARAESQVFDQKGIGFALRAAFDLTGRTQLTLDYNYRWGVVIFHAVSPRPDIVALTNERVAVKTFGPSYVAYKIDATTQGFAVGLNQALTGTLGGSPTVSSRPLASAPMIRRRCGWRCRIRADFFVLVSLEGRVLFDSEQAPRAGKPFAVVVVPLLAPDPEAWICLGFRIDNAFAQELGALSKQAVSFLQQDAGGKVLASALPAAPASSCWPTPAANASPATSAQRR